MGFFTGFKGGKEDGLKILCHFKSAKIQLESWNLFSKEIIVMKNGSIKSTTDM